MTKFTLVGKVINTHGIKGGLKVFPYTFDPKRYEEYKKIFLGEDKLEAKISSIQYQNNIVIIYLDGYKDINEVSKFVDLLIFIDRSEEAKLKEGSYYIDDLRGLKVFNTQQELLGVLKDVLVGYKNDVFVVRTENKEVLVPAVKEFIKKIDIKEKIIIEPIKGMFNED